MSASEQAVESATRLQDLEFAEFTAKLIGEVFDAIVSSNIRQQEAYAELLERVSLDIDRRTVLIFGSVWQYLAVIRGVGEETPPCDAAAGLPQTRLTAVISVQSTPRVPTALHNERHGTTPRL